MKFNWKSVAASLAVLVGISGVAFGQDRDNRHHDDHQNHDSHARVEHHDWNHDRDHGDWNRGRVVVVPDHRIYDHRVYNGWYGNRDPYVYRERVYTNGGYPYYGNSGYYGNGGYYAGGGGYYGGNASQIGYQDGLNDGRSDRQTGHSFRPTQDDNFKNATRGYSSAFGDKQSYKNTYRQGYEQGYQRGYGR